MTTDLGVSRTSRIRQPALARDVAMRLAATEYERVVTVLEQLSPEQWAAPTDCVGWDVRAMAGHLLGMAQMAASQLELAKQQFAAWKRLKQDGGLQIDALTAVQVDKLAGLTRGEVVEQMRRIAPRSARGRRRTPAIVRDRMLPQKQVMDGKEESWSIGYLIDVILTRDPFMHRIDIAQATGVSVPASTEHEGVIVDDVLREWADRHGQAYSLDLTGPAGGQWSRGDAETITMDAFEFCRILSGRVPATGLLAAQVPF